MTTPEPTTTTETLAERDGRTFHLLARTALAAPAEQVWAKLADLPRWHEWNPFLVQASGQLAVGERLTIRFQPQGGRATTIRPTVTAYEPGRHLAWLGRFLVPGVFDGAHELTVTPTADGCVLVQEERFSGVLVPVLRGWLTRGTLPAFAAMNEALRARVAS